jgi:hypothetical protein
MILKIQRSFPEHSIRSVESVLILERLCVSSRSLCWVGRELLDGSNRRKMVADSHDVCALLIPGPALRQQLDNFGQWQPLLVVISWIEELIRIRVGIILAYLGDEVAKSREEGLSFRPTRSSLLTASDLAVTAARGDANGWPRVADLSTVRALMRDGSLLERSPRRRGACCTSSEASRSSKVEDVGGAAALRYQQELQLLRDKVPG